MPTTKLPVISNRILIVNSDPRFCAQMENAFGVTTDGGKLSAIDLDVEYVALQSCEKAIRSANPQERYSVAFVDVSVGNYDSGRSIIERLWNCDPEIQVVACTDNSASNVRSEVTQPDKIMVLSKLDSSEVRQVALTLSDKRNALLQNRDLLFSVSTRLQEAEESLRLKNRHLELASTMARVGYGSMDLATQLVELSANACRIFGVEPQAHHSVAELMSIFEPIDRVKIQLLLDDAIYHASDFEYKFSIKHRDGQSRYVFTQVTCERDANKAKTSLFLVVRDVTSEEAALQAVQHASMHDSLTELPNRAMFNEELESALQKANRNCASSSLILLDLDRFKEVNDSYGHPVGDELLKQFAYRLRSCVRYEDLVARLGGDEFAIILSASPMPADTLGLIERLFEEMKEPFQIGGKSLYTTFSAGVAIAPQNGNDVDSVLKNADLALYRAKQDGRGVCRFFDSEMHQQLRERIQIESDLKYALERDEFRLHYQPIICTRTQKILGMEALVRWFHPERGLVRPDMFIGVAESTSAIVPIGKWILERACRDACLWPEGVFVAVNVSAVQLQHGDFCNTVRETLAKTGFEPQRLEVEITETAFLGNGNEAIRTLNGIQRLGVRIAMDDFGAGYSSLSYFRNFPFDKIKLDRSFMLGNEQPESRAIISAVAGIGDSLGLETCAEGVETKEQFDIACHEGYSHVQGYFFGKPQPLDKVLQLFRSHDKLDS